MNEAETRAEHIDPALKAAGWGVVEGSRIRREHRINKGRIEGHGKNGKADIADYVLEFRNHMLGVLEAKALEEELTEGVGQAKKYAGKLAPLLKLKYHSIQDAVADLGNDVGKAFAGFQKYLYQDVA